MGNRLHLREPHPGREGRAVGQRADEEERRKHEVEEHRLRSVRQVTDNLSASEK
jgi:hypothetical protein